MNKKLIIILLALALTLTACKKNKEEEVLNTGDNIQVEITSETNGNENEIQDPNSTTNEASLEVENSGEEAPSSDLEETEATDEENQEENLGEENQEISEEVVYENIEEEIKALENSSDYISIIKMSQTGPNGKEVHVVEDLKGSLKNIVIPDIDSIQPNYNYLVFLMDSESGDITLTDQDRGVFLIENETDEKLLILRDLLKPIEEEEEENNN